MREILCCFSSKNKLSSLWISQSHLSSDRRDAELILKLLVEKRFPTIWMPSQEQFDLPALLLPVITGCDCARRSRMLFKPSRSPMDCDRVSAFGAMTGKRRSPSCPCRRTPLAQMTAQVAEQAEQRSGARLLLTHPGVGPVTALATDVFLGDPQRIVDGKALASHVRLIPREYSSGAHQRLGALTKQGRPFLRFLWNEAGAHAVRRDPELQRFYRLNWCRRGWGKPAWRQPASCASRCGSCCATRSITKNSVVADRSSKAVPPVRECLKSGMVRTVTVRLIRLPVALRWKGVCRGHHGRS
jgi:hypothetical protein